MVNINEEFPSKYLKASDLNGGVAKVKISNVSSETIGTDRKLILLFAGKSKGMVLNKTNARTIADVFGDETDDWIGGSIEVFAMKVDFQGRMVDGLRVRVPRQQPSAPTQERDWQAPASAGPNTGPVNVAPNARARAEMVPADLDDEIPF